MDPREMFILYRPWARSPYEWEALFGRPVDSLKAMLTRIDRAPRQVAFRQGEDCVDVYARLPDCVDDAGKPVAVLFAAILTGLTLAEADSVKSYLKAKGWQPESNNSLSEAA